MHKQLAAADLLLLNKADLAAPDELAKTERWIEQNYPALRHMVCEHAKISNEILDAAPSPLAERETEHGHSHEDFYLRWSLVSAQPLARAPLENALKNLPGGVLRLKGIVIFDGEPGAWSVQCVGPRCTITPHPESADSRLVAIGLKAKLHTSDLDDLFASSGQE